MRTKHGTAANFIKLSVVHPWHFGTDPGLRSTTYLRIQIWIWILLFSVLSPQWLTRCQQKIIQKYFCLLLFDDTLTSVSIYKKSKRRQKIVGIKVFLTSVACWWKDPDPYKIMTDPDPGGLNPYGSGSPTLISRKIKFNIYRFRH